MDVVRDEIFADSAFAGDEDLGITSSRSIGHRQQLDHYLALDHHRGPLGKSGQSAVLSSCSYTVQS